MNTEKQIEFDKIKEIWAALAVTAQAREQIANAEVITDEATLRKQLKDTTDSRQMIDLLGAPPLQNVTEAEEIVAVAQRGDCLTPYQLERVENVLVVVERLRDYLRRGKRYDNPLAYYDENLDDVKELRDVINMQIRNEEVDDRASKTLLEVRIQIMRLEDTMKQKAEQVIRANKECMADTFYTQRNGRFCVPVKKDYRGKIQGSVIDKSSTGSTLFIEPASVAKCFEELQLLKIEEENEVYRILYALSAMVADAAPAMEESLRMIEKLDFIFSKGKLSVDLDCTEPEIGTDRRIVLKQARHPLMDRAVNIPLDFALGESEHGIIITGPNTGGKTVAIKTVMLTCCMAQCGLHVTCGEAKVCMNSNYLCDIGDNQNLSENLSTFSAHITNVLEILRHVNKDSLVIMDELGSGTDPAEGMGIAIAILEELRKSGANFLVTTHYPEVKDYADRTEGIVKARMTFDKDTLMPTYRMVIGEAGESCAFYIADRLGMPAEMLKIAAVAAYGEKAAKGYHFSNKELTGRSAGGKLKRIREVTGKRDLSDKFHVGDSVKIYPDKKVGIVYEPADEKGIMRVQVAGRKIYINQKRVKLLVKAEEMYPEDYDFSIIFDTVENRKARHEMERKLTDKVIVYDEDA